MRTAAQAAALVLILAATASHATTLRVGLLRKQPATALTVVGPCVAADGGGRRARIAGGQRITVRRIQRGLAVEGAGLRRTRQSLTISPISARERVTVIAEGEARPYRGRVVVRPAQRALLIINLVDVDDYVRAVLPCEMLYKWPPQALAAQAVVIRSFALAQKGRHSAEGFDLCDLTHCQAYRWAAWERQQTDRAVAATRSQVLTFGGKAVAAPFHSTCGGWTTVRLYESHTPAAYLSSVDDSRKGRAFCAGSGHYKWLCTLSEDDLRRVAESAEVSMPAHLKSVQATKRDASGRVLEVKLIGDSTVAVPGYDFMIAAGRTLGWNKIKSTMFEVRKSRGGFVFTGRGLGHGMGLCQWGARGMAEEGYSYRQVLEHYFPRCRIQVRR